MNCTDARYDRLVVFTSVHDALRAAKILTAAGIAFIEIPTPREIDLSCGQSILITAAEEEAALEALEGVQARWARLYSRDGSHKIYEKLKEYAK